MGNELLKGVQHLNHASIKFDINGLIIYVDPFKINGKPSDADLIFSTHTHFDHLSIEDIQKVLKQDSILVATKDANSQVDSLGIEIFLVEPDNSYEVKGVKFSTVPAYNINKNFHPKNNGWVGYIIELNGIKYYIPGDTDFIPEMNSIKADVVFMPVGGTYTMDATEAAKATNIIKPKVAVPIHFGDIVGSKADAKKFIDLLDKSITGVILI